MTTYSLSANAKLTAIHKMHSGYFVGADGVLCLSGGVSDGAQSVAYLPIGGDWEAVEFKMLAGRAW
jgi:hypothetical protein